MSRNRGGNRERGLSQTFLRFPLLSLVDNLIESTVDLILRNFCLCKMKRGKCGEWSSGRKYSDFIELANCYCIAILEIFVLFCGTHSMSISKKFNCNSKN